MLLVLCVYALIPFLNPTGCRAIHRVTLGSVAAHGGRRHDLPQHVVIGGADDRGGLTGLCHALALSVLIGCSSACPRMCPYWYATEGPLLFVWSPGLGPGSGIYNLAVRALLQPGSVGTRQGISVVFLMFVIKYSHMGPRPNPRTPPSTQSRESANKFWRDLGMGDGGGGCYDRRHLIGGGFPVH